MRKTRISIVGPSDSVRLIAETIREFEGKLSITNYIYADATEVPGIVDAYEKETDIWLFSGKVPYSYAVTVQTSTKPKFFIPHTGTSIYRVLLQIARRGISLNGISFDSFSRKEIMETFADTDTPLPDIYVNDYQGIVQAQALTEAHYELWRKGKANVVVTGLYATYNELVKRGVDCFRIWPTRSNVRATMALALSKVETMQSKAGQVAIQQIAIDDYDEWVRSARSGYEVLKTELRLQEILLRFSETLEGMLVPHGNGQFTLYSTRGIIEEYTHGFTCMPIAEEIGRNLSLGVSGGIGLGDTVYVAGDHAHIARGLARRKGQQKWMVVLDDKTTIGPLDSENRLTYSFRTDDLAWVDMARSLNVNATTLNRLMSSFTKLDGEVFGADVLAKQLSITPRSVNRLLGALVGKGAAEVVGEEAKGAGRPRRLYRIYPERLIGKK